MHAPSDSPLGQRTVYTDRYDPALLFAIARAPQRQALGLAVNAPLPFTGADQWGAYELSWRNARGKPQLALARFTIPCETPFLIESKSFKLYLGSFANSRFADADVVQTTLRSDLQRALWGNEPPRAGLGLQLLLPDAFGAERIAELDGIGLDRLDVACEHDAPAPELLRVDSSQPPVEECLTSRLLKSNCPVTGQPDWASVQVRYRGAPINQEGLLQYIVSFRDHAGFHEDCVERIWLDVWQRCRPQQLTVYARYTRRGGLDINPLRTSSPGPMPEPVRHARQ